MKTIVWFGFVLGALSAAGKVTVTKPGQSAILECGVKTYSKNLVWNHGTNLICSDAISSRFPFRRKGTSSTALKSKLKHTSLEISQVNSKDAGKFTCMADGKNYEHTLLVFSVSASPSVELQLGSTGTLQCQVHGLDPLDSPVQWKRPGGSLHAESQNVELKSVAHSDAGNWICTFSHDGAMYSESLTIKVHEPKTTVLPSTQSPKDHKTNCLNCVTQPPSNAAPLLGLSWWMWVIVGVGCLVVVLLMVLIIVLCKRIKRRKKRIHKMKNGGLPMKPKKYCQCDRPAAAAKPQQGRRREKPSAPPLQPLLME